MASLPFLLLLLLTTRALIASAGDTFRVDFHHRFSEKVRRWAESQGLSSTWHPEEAPEGSVEYYKELVKHDRELLRRRGRSLAVTNDVYSFAAGNETQGLPGLG
jgi:hypothetical protein